MFRRRSQLRVVKVWRCVLGSKLISVLALVPNVLFLFGVRPCLDGHFAKTTIFNLTGLICPKSWKMLKTQSEHRVSSKVTYLTPSLGLIWLSVFSDDFY